MISVVVMPSTATVPSTNTVVNPATNKIYVPNYGSKNVTVIDGTTNNVTTVVAGTKPYAVAVDLVTNKIYIPNDETNDVTVITEQQVQAMRELAPAGYIGTPSFLKIIVEKAEELGLSLPSVQKAMFGGEAYPPSLRDWFTAHGIAGYQCYATADLGLIAYETEAREGLVLDEGVIVEIVRPGTGDPVAEGEVGELVVTTLNPDYPLIRFGTGDLSAVLPGNCPTGRTNTRIKGWMGRADQTTKIRGMFVHPKQVDEVVKRFSELSRARLVVSGEMANDVMTLKVEVAAPAEGLAARIGEAVRDVTKLRARVEVLTPGALPNDGKVIDDIRSYK